MHFPRRFVPSPSVLLWMAFAALLTANAAGARPQVDWDQPLSIELENAPLPQTLGSFAKIMGVDLDLDPRAEGAVTLVIKTLPLPAALDAVCRGSELRCEILSPGMGDEGPSTLWVRPAEGRAAGYVEGLSLSLRGADLKRVLESFGALANRPVEVAPTVEGRVSVDVTQMPWDLALTHVCEQGGCRVDWVGEAIRVEPAPPLEGGARLSLSGAKTSEVFTFATTLPDFGVLGTVGLSMADGLAPRITVDSGGLGVVELFDHLCEAAGCTWRLRYGVSTILELEPKDPRLGETVDLPSESVGTGAAGDLLARALGLAFEPHPDLDLTAEVTLPGDGPKWRTAADALCRQARCRWAIEGESLALTPAYETLRRRPESTVDAEKVRVTAELSGGPSVTREARFTWASPVSAIDLAAADGDWTLRLAWIPFSTDHRVLVPSWIPCEQDSGAPRTQAAIPLPIEGGPSVRSDGGLRVELASATGKDEAASPLAGDCGLAPADVTVTLVDPPAADGAAEGDRSRTVRRRLEDHPRFGSYFLVVPSGSPGPAAAILSFGRDPEGTSHLRIVRPEGSSAAVADLQLSDGSSHLEVLRLDDGRKVELTLTAGDGPRSENGDR